MKTVLALIESPAIEEGITVKTPPPTPYRYPWADSAARHWVVAPATFEGWGGGMIRIVRPGGI